jgi:hypothetical protein
MHCRGALPSGASPKAYCTAGGLRAWAAKRISAALAQVQLPQLALERVVIRNGDLWATLTGEAVPRHVQNVDLKLRLGRDYRTLTLDISGAPLADARVQWAGSQEMTIVMPAQEEAMSAKLRACLWTLPIIHPT